MVTVPVSGWPCAATILSAVDAQHAPPLAPAQQEVEVLVHDEIAVGLRDARELHHVFTAARRWLELEAHLLDPARWLDALDLLELLHARLHLGGVRGAGLEALDEGELLLEHGLLPLEGGLLLRFGERLLLHVELVVAGVRGELAAVDLENARAHPVEELAVVRRHEQRAVVLFQELLEPDERLEIEVVRRLVEQHRVGLHQQNARERDAHLPAARERAHVAVDHRWAEAQAREDLTGAALERVAAQLVEAGLHLAEAGDERVELVGFVRVGHVVLELLELTRDLRDVARAVHRLFDDRPAAHLADVLPEVADRDAAIDAHRALVRRLFLHDVAEEGGLAGAVRAHEADLLALVERRRGTDEENLTAVLRADGVEANHVAQAHRSTPALRHPSRACLPTFSVAFPLGCASRCRRALWSDGLRRGR
jgi:hypothetical protein